MFIIIDGDDIGRKITLCYLRNDEAGLSQISKSMATAVARISEILEQAGMRVIFCAADGVVGATNVPLDLPSLFQRIQEAAPKGITFSAGVGASLREAYLALTHAKCLGKNLLSEFTQLTTCSEVKGRA